MTTEELTVDVAVLKLSVAELQRQFGEMHTLPKSNWLPDVVGSFADFPGFDKIVEFGAEFRKTGELPDEADSDEVTGV